MSASESADGLALRRAVCAAPDDDLPRLVYADFLEERGDEKRARFIRLQCAQARELWGSRRWAELGEQAAAVHPGKDAWRENLAGLAVAGEFVRGFVGRVVTEADVFLDRGPELFGLDPVDEISVVGCHSKYLTKLLTVLSHGRVRSLDLGDCFLSPHDLGTIADAGAGPLACLERLMVRRYQFDWPTHAVRRVLESLPRLATIGPPDGGWGPAATRELVQCPEFSRFSELAVTGGRTSVAAVADGPHTAGLRRLRLYTSASTALPILARSVGLAGLEVLELLARPGLRLSALAADAGAAPFARTLKVLAVRADTSEADLATYRHIFPSAHIYAR